jgi:hypothetical protein
VGTPQIVFGVLIVAATAALGAYYGWRQWQTLRRLRADTTMSDEERSFVRHLAWRRLAGSAALLLFAALFVGMFFLERPLAQLMPQGEEARAQEGQRELKPELREFLRFYVGYWITVLLLLLAIIALAGYEFFVIRRYSVRQLRRIQDERRAMIASETARLRRERNGQAGGT